MNKFYKAIPMLANVFGPIIFIAGLIILWKGKTSLATPFVLVGISILFYSGYRLKK